MTILLVAAVLAVFFIVVLVAAFLGRGVKAALKVWFASISVEVTDKSRHD
jgi:hypothetical protein